MEPKRLAFLTVQDLLALYQYHQKRLEDAYKYDGPRNSIVDLLQMIEREFARRGLA